MDKNRLCIPDSFKEKIACSFGEGGKAWLERLPDLLERIILKWRLTDCRTEGNLSVHYICYAYSPDYGEVVLKTGVPHLELFSGMDALRLYGGKITCRLYESEREMGAMLLERIVPGTQLKAEPDSKRRIEIAAGLANKLPRAIEGQHEFPVYQMQMEKAFGRARRENRAGEEFLAMLDRAEGFYAEIRRQNRPQLLLHGDLHHENILQDASGNWKAIDPQGRIGEQCLEVGRFFLNEWGLYGGLENPGLMANGIDAMAAAMGETRRNIAISCFLDCALSHCWSLEDGDCTEAVRRALAIMQPLLELL